MKRIFVLFLSLSLLTFFSCEKSDDFGNKDDMNIIFSDNQQAIRGNIKYQYDLDNCGKFNIITAVKAKDGTYSELRLTLLSNGSLVQVKYYKQNSEDEGVYCTPHLQPEKSFRIENFNHDRTSGKLSFGFKGIVYEDSDEKKEKQLEGMVNINSIKYAPCEGLIFDVLTEDTGFQFFSFYSSIGKSHGENGEDDDIYRYFTYSNSGQHLTLRLGEDISKLVGQEIEFSEYEVPYRVIYREYEGPIMTQESYGRLDHHWKDFQTRGKIQDIQKIEGDKSVKPYYTGRIIMDILDKGNVIKKDVVLPFYVTTFDK